MFFINFFKFITINVKDMGLMFSECSSLTSLNLSNFNTNNVTNMSYMFDHLKNDCKIISSDNKLISIIK